MDPQPDGTILPGECPLCLVEVALPYRGESVVPILADHFGSACEATRFVDPATT